MMGMQKKQTDKIIKGGNIVVVELDGITYTPMGKFKKPAQYVIGFLRERMDSIDPSGMKEEYAKGYEFMKKEEPSDIIIEKESVIFVYSRGKVIVHR